VGPDESARSPVPEPDVDRALELAMADAEGPVVVAGSLYLVGAVRQRLVLDPDLVDPPLPRSVAAPDIG
jgi:folylpolyglutamate synthase/dihydropteroate synthase